MTTPGSADLPVASGAAPPGRRALVFVFVTVALDMMALGLIGPVFVPLVERFTGGNAGHAAAIVGLAGTAFAFMQFVWSPLLGVLSDRFGRKPVIVLSNIGTAFDYAVMAVAPNVAWLFAGRVVSGITSASATAASAYIADVTPPEKRAAAFGQIGAAFGLGFVLGPALGGLLGSFGDRVPFWAAAALSAINGLYGAFVLPESLRREHRSAAFAWRKANPLGALRVLRSHPDLTALGAMTFGSSVAGMVMPATWVLYVTYRYHWQPGATGVSLAFLGLCSALAQALAIGPFVKRFGERASMVTGIACGSLGLTIFGFAPNGWVFAVGIPLMCLWGLSPAAAQAIMTRRVGPTEQGSLQGALGSLRGLASLVGPAVYTGAFAYGIAGGRGFASAAWFLAAAIIVLMLVPALRETTGDAAPGAAVA